MRFFFPYLKLKYCGYAYNLFNKILEDSRYSMLVEVETDIKYHAPQTKTTKEIIIQEIVKDSSRIRVIFAITALGMGVNTPYVERVIHIQPPCNIELQEIRRAGRNGQPAVAILYYNNSDISANNKENVDDKMKVVVSMNHVLEVLLYNTLDFKIFLKINVVQGVKELLRKGVVKPVI